MNYYIFVQLFKLSKLFQNEIHYKFKLTSNVNAEFKYKNIMQFFYLFIRKKYNY